ncbi:globin family protein [Arachidicoccus soli]|uniref:Hemin receptor n=1 Tax=Arachidicoccus soli TaxID=2341117 RepID=A0A386HP11_9BACT|nr:globin family protein [Arachidicoccus soli]AYD47678.1 hemin receptor [Arachidicoccus soli]
MENKIIQNVQNSFQSVLPISAQAAAIFYSKLFEKDPSLQPLFKGDMKEQGKKLMMMLSMAVNSLTNMQSLVPVLENLGKRHLAYGVSDEMYDTVGTALIETLETGLGESFTEDIKSSWVAVYTQIASIMKNAA